MMEKYNCVNNVDGKNIGRKDIISCHKNKDRFDENGVVLDYGNDEEEKKDDTNIMNNFKDDKKINKLSNSYYSMYFDSKLDSTRNHNYEETINKK